LKTFADKKYISYLVEKVNKKLKNPVNTDYIVLPTLQEIAEVSENIDGTRRKML